MLRNGCRVAAAASTKGGAEAAAELTPSGRLFHGRKVKGKFFVSWTLLWELLRETMSDKDEVVFALQK